MPSRSPAPQVALVTGAADRIGAAIARRLAVAGYSVVIHHRGGAAEARVTAAEIEAAGGRAALVAADLAKRGDRATLIAHAAKPFGPLTLLVNNASTFKRDSLADLEEALWDAHFAVHAEAPVFLTRDFAAQLPASVIGNVVNIVDERVLHTAPSFFSYTLSKATLWSATRTLAQSLAPRVRVNAIGPGLTLKDEGQGDAEFNRLINALPLKRGPTPEEIAEAVVFLVSTPSITGHMLTLDGGEHIGWPPQGAPTPRK